MEQMISIPILFVPLAPFSSSVIAIGERGGENRLVENLIDRDEDGRCRFERRKGRKKNRVKRQ